MDTFGAVLLIANGAVLLVACAGVLPVPDLLVAGLAWWRPVLITTTVLSLVITALDWRVALAGVIVRVVILAVVIRLPIVWR